MLLPSQSHTITLLDKSAQTTLTKALGSNPAHCDVTINTSRVTGSMMEINYQLGASHYWVYDEQSALS